MDKVEYARASAPRNLARPLTPDSAPELGTKIILAPLFFGGTNEGKNKRSSAIVSIDFVTMLSQHEIS